MIVVMVTFYIIYNSAIVLIHRLYLVSYGMWWESDLVKQTVTGILLFSSYLYCILRSFVWFLSS